MINAVLFLDMRRPVLREPDMTAAKFTNRSEELKRMEASRGFLFVSLGEVRPNESGR